MLFDKEEIYDFYDYSSTGNIGKFKDMIMGYEIPDHIKEGNEKSVDVKRLNDNCFALIVKEGSETYRKFPVNNYSETWFSKVAFIHNYEKLPFLCRERAANSIKSACDHFGIEVESALSAMSTHARDLGVESSNVVNFNIKEIRDMEMSGDAKLASDERFALEFDERFPINNPMEIKIAMEFFSKNKDKLIKDGVAEEFADNVKIAGEMYSIDCNDSINEVLNLNMKVPYGYIDIHLENRIKKASEHMVQSKGKDWWGEVIKSMEDLRDNAPYMTFDKVSSDLTKIDRSIGIDSYRGNIISPKDLFNVNSIEKKAFGGSSTSVRMIINEDYEGEKQENTMGMSDKAIMRKDDLTKLGLKIKKNNNMIKGHFNSKTTQGLVNDFTATYKTLDKIDREILKTINDENIES